MDSLVVDRVAPIQTGQNDEESDERTMRVPRKAWCETSGDEKVSSQNHDIVEEVKCESAKEKLKQENDGKGEKRVSTGATFVSKVSNKIVPFPGHSLPITETNMVRNKNTQLQREITVKTLTAVQHFKKSTRHFIVNSTDCTKTCCVVVCCNICFCAGVVCKCSWTKIHMKRMHYVYEHYFNHRLIDNICCCCYCCEYCSH